MGVPDGTSLELFFPEMALSLKRGAHFALAPLIKFLVVVAVPQQIALGPGVASRLHSGLPYSKLLSRPSVVPILESAFAHMLSRLSAVHEGAHFMRQLHVFDILAMVLEAIGREICSLA